jgi:hypothetical protein
MRLPVLLLVLAACGSQRAAAPSAFEQQLERLAISSAHYGPPRGKKPLPLAPGQWIKRHVIDQDGHHALVTTKVIGLFGRQVWLESETETDQGVTAIKLLASVGDRRDPKQIQIYRYAIKHPDGRVEQLPAMLLGALKPRLQRTLAEVLVFHPPIAQEDVAVAAGQFSGAYRARVKLDALGSSVLRDTWWHSGVPLNGSLRTVGVSAPGKSELVAFGLSGAKSVF